MFGSRDWLDPSHEALVWGLELRFTLTPTSQSRLVVTGRRLNLWFCADSWSYLWKLLESLARLPFGLLLENTSQQASVSVYLLDVSQTSWGGVSSLLTGSEVVEGLFKESGLPVLIGVKSVCWATGRERSTSLCEDTRQRRVPFGWPGRTGLANGATSFISFL